MAFQCLNLGLLNILEFPLNIATSVLKATNDTTPLLIEVIWRDFHHKISFTQQQTNTYMYINIAEG